MTAGLAVLAGIAGLLLALAVLWPLRARGRAGFLVACLSIGLASASLYLLVGDPRAAQEPAAPSLAELRDGVQALEQALEQEPQRADGWVLLGRSRGELGQLDAAAAAYSRAAALAPDDAGVLVEAAQARAQADPEKHFDDRALGWLQHALQVQPDAERAAWLLGIALRQRGRDAEAVAVWSALLPRLQPGAAAALQQQLVIARAAAGAEAPAASSGALQENAAPLLSIRIALPPGFDPRSGHRARRCSCWHVHREARRCRWRCAAIRCRRCLRAPPSATPTARCRPSRCLPTHRWRCWRDCHAPARRRTPRAICKARR